jgi:hypothetical protein
VGSDGRSQEQPPQPASDTARESEEVLKHLNARGFVPFHPTLAQHLGHKPALFLGLCLYWTRHGARNNPHRQGWFYLSAHEITAATTLSRREQESVRELLSAADLIEQQLVGRPAKMHYRLKLRQLANRLEVIDAATATPDTVWAWFEKSVSFYRPLGDLAGSAAGGLFLSFILRQQRKALLAGRAADVLRVDPSDIERTLCLSPKVQRSVRQRLMRLGILTTPLNAASMLRVNIQAILACLRGQDVMSLPGNTAGDASSAQSLPGPSDGAHRHRDLIVQQSLFVPAEPDARPAHALARDLALLRTAMFEPHRRGGEVADFQQLGSCTQGAFQSAPLEPTPRDTPSAAGAQSANLGSATDAQTAKLEPLRCAQTAKLGVPKPPSYIQTGSTNTTTTNPRASAARCESHDGCRRRSGPAELGRSFLASAPVHPAAKRCGDVAGELIFPDGLPIGVLDGLRHAVQQAPVDLRQRLLDELHGQLQIPTKTIHNPVAWMLGLVRRSAEGAVLAFADKVASDRDRRAATPLQAAQTVGSAPEFADPELKEISRERLRALRQEFGLKAGRS